MSSTLHNARTVAPNLVRMAGLLMLTTLIACQSSTNAQEAGRQEVDTTRFVPAPEARMSPVAVAAGILDDGTYLKIVYSSPRKRDRTIFGGLVPYGEIWRTGANEATEITVTRDVRFGPETLPAGTYALFTIPSEDQWTIIVNRDLGQWGAYDYDPESDLFRFTVPVRRPEKVHEAFTISVDEDGPAIRMTWDDTEVVVPVEASR